MRLNTYWAIGYNYIGYVDIDKLDDALRFAAKYMLDIGKMMKWFGLKCSKNDLRMMI